MILSKPQYLGALPIPLWRGQGEDSCFKASNFFYDDN
jgi:hypothetical protein